MIYQLQRAAAGTTDSYNCSLAKRDRAFTNTATVNAQEPDRPVGQRERHSQVTVNGSSTRRQHVDDGDGTSSGTARTTALDPGAPFEAHRDGHAAGADARDAPGRVKTRSGRSPRLALRHR